MSKILLPIAVVFGAVIAYVDSRPSWDDTGITAVAIVVLCGLFGIIAPRRPWLWALAVGIWIPLLGVIRQHNYGSLLALALAFAGAYTGMFIRRSLAPVRD